MLQPQRVSRTYSRHVSDYGNEELLRELLKRTEIEPLRNLLLQIEMNGKFKKLKEKTDYSKRHLLMDLSVLLDSSSPKLLDELHRSEMISIVIVPQYLFDNVSKFSNRDIEELEENLKLWTRRKMDAQRVLNTLKSFFSKVQESFHIEIVGAIDYLSTKLGIEKATLEEDDHRIMEGIKENFKEKYEFAAKILSEIILLAQHAGVKLFSLGIRIKDIFEMAFSEIKNITVGKWPSIGNWLKKTQKSKRIIQVSMLLIYNISLSEKEEILSLILELILKYLKFLGINLELPSKGLAAVIILCPKNTVDF